ncbi:hypothetical protein PG984_013061 [Apiospora sp. TS-2023a]
MSISTLRSLSMTSRRYRNLGRGFVFEKEVEDERLFDEARKRSEQLRQVKGLVFTDRDIEAWPERTPPVSTPLSQDDYAVLNTWVNRWGKGVLWLNQERGSVYTRQLSKLTDGLPYFMRGNSLIYRAIEKCSDIQAMEQVIDAYLLKYPIALQGKEDTHRRPDLAHYRMYGDPSLPPVLWACGLNRVDVLELLHTKNNEHGRRAEEIVDLNMTVANRQNKESMDHMWRIKRSTLPDLAISQVGAWEAAFYRLKRNGKRPAGSMKLFGEGYVAESYGMFYAASEDVCIWLLRNKVGFSWRPNADAIVILAQAAARKMVRVLRALIPYFEHEMDPPMFQHALTVALHAVAGDWIEPSRPFGGREWLLDVCDGNEEVIDILIAASTRIPASEKPQSNVEHGLLSGASALLRQDPDRRYGEGMLASAVSRTPRNAVYLLKLQMAHNITDHRDVREALILVLRRNSGRGDTQCLEFFKMVFPLNVHLVYSPAESKSPQGRFKAYRNLIDSFNSSMDDWVRKILSDNTATGIPMYLGEVLGRARLGEGMITVLERGKAECLCNK